ncbi:ephrin_rec_like domain-containing protein [Trichonephila clavipes]|uniref:Ephrin_rec_like domain-containing protein n=1 Tax=Trichonephila clavipes TaxID=2585209 RepID=A0A8X6RJI6_TRICX|nr:ephrin_rec_like domain-containing protein [Trichonephila clavipes]
MPVFSAASDRGPLRSSTAFRITVLKPLIPYSANSHWISTDTSSNSNTRCNADNTINRNSDFVPAQFGSCSPGYRIDQDKCYPCPSGSYTSGQDSSCSLCPRDFYINRKAADSCFPCPDGKKTMIEGADSEDLCVYIDTSGRPLETPSTKLLVLGICAAIFILTAW